MEHTPSFLSAVLGLVFVLGLIFLISYFFKRFASPLVGGAPPGRKETKIKLIDIKAIDPKNRLVLIGCKNKEYLLMTGESNLVVDSFDINEDNACANQEVPHADS